MSDKPQIKLAETVVLIDAAFLNFVITDIKGYFEETLHRSLQEIDLSMLTTYITLDAAYAAEESSTWAKQWNSVLSLLLH